MPILRAACWGAAVSVAALVLFAFNPAEWAFFPRCPLHLLTGLYCPGCGSQRAIHLLLHGDVGGALHHNALLVLSLPLLGYVGLRRVAAWRWSSSLPAPYTRRAWLWTLAALVVAFFALRNVGALSFLAPPA